MRQTKAKAKAKRDSGTVLTDEELAALDAHWRAANYLAVGQIYLMGNALLTEPLRPEHIKPRLLGHWGPPQDSTSSTPTSTASSRTGTGPPCVSGVPGTGDRPCWPTPGWRARTPRRTRT